ncbi:MAG: hypothetical protein KDA21_04250 [Phycisphaerales bacterium]|nr:hypothetical protein [Phycisphaerales bacterium]
MNGRIDRTTFSLALGVLVIIAVSFPLIFSWLDVHLTKSPIEVKEWKFPSLAEKQIPVTGEAKWVRVGAERPLSEAEVEELGTANYLSRWFEEVNPPEGRTPRRFQLHCAYYTGMIDTVPHVPERCLVGAGIDMSGKGKRVPIHLDLSNRVVYPDPDIDQQVHGRILVARSRATQNPVRLPANIEDLAIYVTPFTAPGGEKIFAGYFFLANGDVVAQANEVRFKAFNLDDDYAYYAKVQFLSADVDSAEELGAMVEDVLNDLLPELMLRVPDWVEVVDGRYPPA